MSLDLKIIKPEKQLFLILLMPLLIDVLIGVSFMYEINVPFGKAYRGVLYLLGVFSIFRYNIKGFFLFFLLMWSTFFMGWLVFSENFSVSREISFMFKATYLFAILQLIKSTSLDLNNKKDLIFTILKRYSQIIAVLIIFSFFTGIGLQTYGKWVFGTSSFFIAQNDIGLSHLLVFTILLFNKGLFKVSWFWLFLIFLSLVLLGTSTGMFGALAAVMLYVFFKLLLAKILSVSNFLIRFFAIISLFVLFVAASISLYNYIINSDYYSRKYDKILNEGFRSTLKDPADMYFKNRGLLTNIFGEGFSSYTTNLGNSVPELKMSKAVYKDWLLVETDPYDFFGGFGLILTVFYFIYFIYLLLISLLNYYNDRSVYNLSLMLVFSMALFHSVMAGHVLYSPTVIGILTAVVFLIQAEYYKKVW